MSETTEERALVDQYVEEIFTRRESRTKNHPAEDIIGDPSDGIQMRKVQVDFKKLTSYIAKVYFVSHLEPKNVAEAFKDER